MYTLHVLLLIFAISACCHGVYSANEPISGISTFRSCANRKMNSSAILQTLPVISEIDCARACKNNKKCRTSNFVRGNAEHQCQLLSAALDNNSSCSDLLPDDTSQVIGMVSHVKSHPTCSYDAVNYPCYFEQPVNATCQCACVDGFRGEFCEVPPRDCSDFCCNGYKWIYPPETGVKLRAVCSGRMMYILQFNESHNAFEEYGNSSWNAFKSGFNFYGSQKYWIGHDVVHSITTKTNHTYTLYMHVKRTPIWILNYYYDFYLGDEASNYTMYFSGSLIHPRGSQTLANNSQFRTTDYNSNECTVQYNAAWWYQQNCSLPPILTGNYAIDGDTQNIYDFFLSLRRNE